MSSPRLRNGAIKLLFLATSGVVALLAAELAVRWLAPQSVLLVDRGLYLADPPRGYRLQPGFAGGITNRVDYSTTVRVDSTGLRGDEIGARVDGRPRLLVLGDSFVFGVGANDSETYPVRLAAHLSEAGLHAEVLNGGVPGYSIPDATEWYEAWGRPLAPDVVLLTVFVGNDLQDAMPGHRATVIDGRLVVPGAAPGGLKTWLFDHSHLYVLLKTSPAGDALRRILGRPIPHERAEAAAELSLYANGAPTEIERVGGAATEEAVRRLVATLPPGRFAAVLLPSVVQVDSAAWARTLAAHGLDPANHDPARPTRWFQAMLERHAVPTLDLSPSFARALAGGERIYFIHDPHLTPAGYDLAAAEVARFVAERWPAPQPSAP